MFGVFNITKILVLLYNSHIFYVNLGHPLPLQPTPSVPQEKLWRLVEQGFYGLDVLAATEPLRCRTWYLYLYQDAWYLPVVYLL